MRGRLSGCLCFGLTLDEGCQLRFEPRNELSLLDDDLIELPYSALERHIAKFEFYDSGGEFHSAAA